ncbi:MAG: flippase-like domain-containing protein [Deltaproteobacteria bacterium]|nr:flippase-like domain-containing protein [Deltaproteobacteria bacterium]
MSGVLDEGREEIEEPSLIQSGGRRWFLDWRVWFGVGITALSLWYVGRGIPLGDVLTAMKSANLPLLLVFSVPAYIASVWVRALRWRHFTNPIAEIPRSALFRAQAIGFLVNNVVPLRIGEFVRAWALARETKNSATAILGTVVIERTLDVASVLLLAAASLTWAGRSGDGSTGLLAQGALLLLPVGCFPVVGLVILRLWPAQIIAIARWFARPLPARVGDTLERLLGSFSAGLGSLSGGSHLFWILFHTLVIWLLLSTIPVIAGIVAFDLDLGPPVEMLMTSWILLAAVGVAVAIPSAPGFFGTYQLAFNAVLERFGVEPATALAIGLVVWFVFWITLVSLGLLVLRTQHTSLGELTHQSGKDPAAERR